MNLLQSQFIFSFIIQHNINNSNNNKLTLLIIT